MKNIVVLFYFFLCSLLSNGQGIRFESGMNWEQVKEKARQENKSIFVSCYATWCMICKTMDNKIYLQPGIGDFFNDRFISVKVQIDSSIKDKADVKQWYQQAHDFLTRYHINAVPAFLFFSADGKPVHLDNGYKEQAGFMEMGAAALDPARQYYTLLESYKNGKKNFAVMQDLARLAKKNGEDDMATTIAREYIDHHLFRLADEKLYAKDNIEFISEFLHTTGSRDFKWMYSYSAKINQVMGDDSYTESKLDNIIAREFVNVELDRVAQSSGKEPDWEKMSRNITKKFNADYADRLVLAGQERWYQFVKDDARLHKTYVKRYARYGVYEPLGPPASYRNTLAVNNNMAWDIFLKNNDPAVLQQAIRWMKELLDRMPEQDWWYPWTIDTYANLLYKAGSISEAIDWQTKALKIARQNPEGKKMSDDIEQCLNQMKSGIPTWPVN